MENVISIAFIFAVCCILIYLDSKYQRKRNKIKSIILFPSGLVTAFNEQDQIIDELTNKNFVKIFLKEISTEYDIDNSEIFLPDRSSLTKVWNVKDVKTFLNLD